jgi:hypothetical protein
VDFPGITSIRWWAVPSFAWFLISAGHVDSGFRLLSSMA